MKKVIVALIIAILLCSVVFVVVSANKSGSSILDSIGSSVDKLFPDKGDSDKVTDTDEDKLPTDSLPSDDIETDESTDIEEPSLHRLSYRNGDISYGFLQSSSDDGNTIALIYYTDLLKPNTKYKVGWRFNSAFIEDQDYEKYPWSVQKVNDSNHLYYGCKYFAYDTSYEAGVTDWYGIYAVDGIPIHAGYSEIISGKEGAPFVLRTYLIEDVVLEYAKEAYDWFDQYVIDIVFEEIEEVESDDV